MVIKATLGLYLRRSIGIVCPDLIEFARKGTTNDIRWGFFLHERGLFSERKVKEFGNLIANIFTI